MLPGAQRSPSSAGSKPAISLRACYATPLPAYALPTGLRYEPMTTQLICFLWDGAIRLRAYCCGARY
eukprot:3465378-Rhodomonas_salina.3